MTACVDASFPLEFLLHDRWWQNARKQWERWLLRGETIVAPPLIRPEVTSTVRRKVYVGTYRDDEGKTVLEISLGLPITIWPDSDDLQRRAYTFASRFNRPRAYDGQYLAVADLLGCELWTADRRLYSAVGGELPWVRWVGEAA